MFFFTFWIIFHKLVWSPSFRPANWTFQSYGKPDCGIIIRGTTDLDNGIWTVELNPGEGGSIKKNFYVIVAGESQKHNLDPRAELGP
jgi:hypothetical protein